MNELFDKLILRFSLILVLCTIVMMYKKGYLLIYQKIVNKYFKDDAKEGLKFYSGNYIIHFFARVLGLVIIFSLPEISLHGKIPYLFSIYFDVLIYTFLAVLLYSISIYLFEGMSLYNFESTHEIFKRENYCYTFISSTIAICMAFIVKHVLSIAEQSIVILLFLWPFCIVIFGLMSKLYKILSPLPFNKMMIHKNMALAVSYSGFLCGITIVLVSSLGKTFVVLEKYAMHNLLNLLLAAIIFPVFKFILGHIFSKEQEHFRNLKAQGEKGIEQFSTDLELGLAYGVAEGLIFIMAAVLTALVSGQIIYENIYL